MRTQTFLDSFEAKIVPQGICFQVNFCQNPFASALHFISESGLQQPDPALGSSSHRGVAALLELDPNIRDNY